MGICLMEEHSPCVSTQFKLAARRRRNLHEKCAARARLALDRDRAAVHLEGLFHNCESQAAAAYAAIARLVGFVEALKNVLLVLGCNPDARVGDPHFESVVTTLQRHPHPASLGSELDAVVDQ